jgi:signal transduction histidine kinase
VNTPINILLVDDEPRNLDVLEGVLQSPELRLVRATHPEEALLALLHEEFAVIVLDIQMPGMSGIELAHLIKQREKTQHIPIIFLTALYQDDQRMLESYNVGAVDYLTKPVNPQVLRSKVAVFVDLFRATVALKQTNTALAQEIKQREQAEASLRENNDALEARVEARTAALREARDEAERAGRTKDDFLAALSHELRTPLNPVLLIASDAANNPAFPAEARALFATIRKNVELEARLIDDLLDLTRIMRGKLALNLRPRDIHGILHDAIANVRPDLEEKKITLQLDLAATQQQVLADDVRLQQVFWNIVKNATKFTAEGGTITVSTRDALNDASVVVSITDTGIGLSRDELARIFDAFSQGDHAVGGRSHRFGGLGLGLTISRSLVEQHHGVLSASSAGRGKGSTFTITLPWAGSARSAARLDQVDANRSAHADLGSIPPMLASKGRRKVLLVEDHEPTRKTLEMLLTRRRYDVAASASIAGARALAKDQKFDVLISDIGLPDGTGFDLMKEMRLHYEIPGIALTGYGMEEDIERSQDAGFFMHLIKPVHVQSLDKALAQLPPAKTA